MKPAAAMPAQIISTAAIAGRCHGAVQRPETYIFAARSLAAVVQS